jgi:2-polyprenyl-3-methyl-5-hydroxy-6-metoxy-1,4-benzoquinol methylase
VRSPGAALPGADQPSLLSGTIDPPDGPPRVPWYPPKVPALSEAKCPACAAPATHWATKDGYRLARCGSCRTVVARVDGRTDAGAADYTRYHSAADYRVATAAQAALDALVNSARRYRRLGGWLDIGFGEGALLATAERCGWNCAGVEVSPHALALGKNRRWTVLHPDEAGEAFPAGAFDVVTLVEVIEHLTDPVRVLGQAVGWLRPGGLLFATTPNADSLNRRWLGPAWSVFCPPEHLTIWSPRGLRRTLRSLGVGDVRLRTHGLNPGEILAATRSLGAPIHRQRAAESLNEALTRTTTRRLVKRAANAVLSFLKVGDTIKVWCEKSS